MAPLKRLRVFQRSLWGGVLLNTHHHHQSGKVPIFGVVLLRPETISHLSGCSHCSSGAWADAGN